MSAPRLGDIGEMWDPELGAEVLRAAARLMRERAEAASWWQMESGEPRRLGWHAASELVGEPFDPAHAEHISSWPPAVALAVADWLDEEVEDHDRRVRTVNDIAKEQGWDHHVDKVFMGGAAIAVARAYLGEST